MIIVNGVGVTIPNRLRQVLAKDLKDGKSVKYPKDTGQKSVLYTSKGLDTGQMYTEYPKMKNIPLRVKGFINNDPESENYLLPDPNGEYTDICVASQVKVENGRISSFVPVKFKKPKVLGPEDYETYFFLKYFSPFVKNGHGGKKSKEHYYEIENKHEDAKIKVSSIRAKAAVEFKLTGDEAETGISDQKIVELAYAYGILNPKKITREEIVEKILIKVASDIKTKEFSHDSDLSGYEYFLTLLDDKEETMYRVLLNKAIEQDVFGYDAKMLKWRFVNDKSQLGTPNYFGVTIDGINPKYKPKVGMLDKLKSDKKFFNTVVDLIKESKTEAVTFDAVEEITDGEARSTVDILKEKLKKQKQANDIAGAIATYQELIEEDPASKQTYTMQIGRLKKDL